MKFRLGIEEYMGIGSALIAVTLVGGAAWGYVWNIVKLVAIVSDPVTGMLVLRAIGVVVVPLGCIIGWL
jgi:hypothetical protein